MRTRRLKKHPAALEVSAFINLIVVLVPFLLSTAVFTRLSVLDLKLPAQNSGPETTHIDNLQLEVIVRTDAIEVNDRLGGRLYPPIQKVNGEYDLQTLSAEMLALKQKFPDKSDASVLCESNTPYDTLVKVMDAMRSTKVPQGAVAVDVELFPGVSIGDAPVTAAEFNAAHPKTPVPVPAQSPAAPPAKKR